MHDRRLASFDEVRAPAVAHQKRFELLARDARQNRGIGDLVAVEVQNGQDHAVRHRVEELVRVPCGRERAGLGLAVPDNARND